MGQGTHSITVRYLGDVADDVEHVGRARSSGERPTPAAACDHDQAGRLPESGRRSARPIRVTATVTTTPPGAAISGTVQFFDGTFALGTVPLSGNQAVVSIEANVAGTYVLTASYSGDAANAPSTSAPVNQVALPYGATGHPGLLAGRLRRRDLHLRRGPVLRLDGQPQVAAPRCRHHDDQ